MTSAEIVEELKLRGNEATKTMLLKHGAKEPFFGVKFEDLKKIQKRIKNDHSLALELYATGISDGMYLAGLIADEAMMTKKNLQRWVEQASWYMLSEYTVQRGLGGAGQGGNLAVATLTSMPTSEMT